MPYLSTNNLRTFHFTIVIYIYTYITEFTFVNYYFDYSLERIQKDNPS